LVSYWHFRLGVIAEWIADDIPDDFDGVSGAIADALARGGGLC
jgi:hypothetical protein